VLLHPDALLTCSSRPIGAACVPVFRKVTLAQPPIRNVACGHGEDEDREGRRGG